jgi:hypothetical protein
VKDFVHFLISSTFGVAHLRYRFGFLLLHCSNTFLLFFCIPLSPPSLLIDQAIGHSLDDCSEFVLQLWNRNSCKETVVHYLDVGMLSFAAPIHGCWLLPFTLPTFNVHKGGEKTNSCFSIGTKLGFMLIHLM